MAESRSHRGIPRARRLALAAALLLGLSRGAVAQENSECLECHSDRTMSKKRAGQTVSLFVDQKRLAKSVHADAPCVGCHSDLAGKELPHEERLAAAVEAQAVRE